MPDRSAAIESLPAPPGADAAVARENSTAERTDIGHAASVAIDLGKTLLAWTGSVQPHCYTLAPVAADWSVADVTTIAPSLEGPLHNCPIWIFSGSPQCL